MHCLNEKSAIWTSVRCLPSEFLVILSSKLKDQSMLLERFLLVIRFVKDSLDFKRFDFLRMTEILLKWNGLRSCYMQRSRKRTELKNLLNIDLNNC